MVDIDTRPAQLRERLWKELDDARIVMLGLVGGPSRHMQPMAVFADPESDAIWFFTKRDTHLVTEAGAGHDAMVCLMAKDMEFQACIHGTLVPDHNAAKIEKYWSPFVAAWYPAGKADPDLSLLRLDPQDARIWISQAGPFTYPWKIAKANVTHTVPDIGIKADIRL